MLALKSQFCDVFVHIKINKMPWKVWKKK